MISAIGFLKIGGPPPINVGRRAHIRPSLRNAVKPGQSLSRHLVAGGHALERLGDVGRKHAKIVRAAARALIGCRNDDLLARQDGAASSGVTTNAAKLPPSDTATDPKNFFRQS
jgi:hypothetical protein